MALQLSRRQTENLRVIRDEPADSLYLILSPTAKRRGKLAPGALRAGDYFGELALFDGAPRSATVVATHELHAMRLPHQSFLRLGHQNPAIWHRMFRNLGAQFRRLETQTAQH